MSPGRGELDGEGRAFCQDRLIRRFRCIYLTILIQDTALSNDDWKGVSSSRKPHNKGPELTMRELEYGLEMHLGNNFHAWKLGGKNLMTRMHKADLRME